MSGCAFAAPFSLVPEEEKILLDIADGENRITTTLYRLR